MSTINDIVLSSQGGQIIDNLARRFGLAPWQAEAAVAALAPALSAGLLEAARSPETLRPILEAASAPEHATAFESADLGHSPERIDAGRALLDQMSLSPLAIGRIAQIASRESHVRPDLLEQMLPVLASIVAGGLASTLEREGRGELLGRLAGSSEPEPCPPPPPLNPAVRIPRPMLMGGGLFVHIAALFGGGGRPPLLTPIPTAPPPAAARGENELAQIREVFAPGAAVGPDHQAQLDELFGEVFAAPAG
jgi:hypothetical protein